MKLPGLFVRKPAIIVHSVGNIAVLLGLQNHHPALNGMYRSGIDLDKISLLHRNPADQLCPPSLMDHLRQFLPCPGIVSHHQSRILRAVQNIPALRFAQRTIFMLPGIAVIRMYLDTQVIPGIYNLYKKREPVRLRISKKLRMGRP